MRGVCWILRWIRGGLVGYMSLGWRGECLFGGRFLEVVSIFMIFKFLNLDAFYKGVSVVSRWRRDEV